MRDLTYNDLDYLEGSTGDKLRNDGVKDQTSRLTASETAYRALFESTYTTNRMTIDVVYIRPDSTRTRMTLDSRVFLYKPYGAAF